MRVPSSTPAGILTLSVLSRRVRPCPAQARHGLSITWPAPWGAGHGGPRGGEDLRARVGPLAGEEAPLAPSASPAMAGRALLRLGAGLSAAALAGLAGDRRRHAHRGLGAAVGLLQRDLEVEAQVLAAHV